MGCARRGDGSGGAALRWAAPPTFSLILLSWEGRLGVELAHFAPLPYCERIAVKTTARVVLALAVVCLTTSNASAFGKMKHGHMATMPAYPMTMAPMMGFGMMPSLPMFPSMLPLGLQGFGGSGMSFSMS